MKIRKQNIFHAYRGTTKEWGKRWENKKELAFSNKSDEYFGHGYYFFENDYNEAVNWVKYVRRIKKSDSCIIYAYIESNKVYDLVDNEVYKQYVKLIKTIEDRYKEGTIKVRLNKPYDCHIINMVVDKYGFEMVRGLHFPNNSVGLRLLEEGYTRVRRTHIQLCIREKDIIKNSEVEYFDRG